ncbi:unnamed protein product, partial [Hydatigera taeniaeformis]|uniref:Kinesin motor domain-containing protein n=1 Tax=Hydatigena taeniaeformis TaxID=6205 RepID=A0A158RF30_HYDTA
MVGGSPRQCNFDYIFNPKDSFLESQKEIFKCIGLKAVEECLDGFNCSIFAYGMTGTGKTYTIFGTKALFESALCRMPNDTFLEISFFEIYNEHVYDLLVQTPEDETAKVSLRVREHPEDGPYVENLSKHAVSHLDDVQRLIDSGTALRATTETVANSKSSRSHSIFTIYINQNVKSSSGISSLQSKLHLIDLAGSEKVRHALGPCYLSETKSINKSLCTLSLVIRKLGKPSRIIGATATYRDFPVGIGDEKTNVGHPNWPPNELPSLRDCNKGRCKTEIVHMIPSGVALGVHTLSVKYEDEVTIKHRRLSCLLHRTVFGDFPARRLFSSFTPQTLITGPPAVLYFIQYLFPHFFCSSLAEMAREEAPSAPHSSLSSPTPFNHLLMQLPRQQKVHIPYRDSKLTWLLRDSLGGNSKTAVVITVSSSELCLHETLHSLRFARRIKMIKNHPIRNQASNRGDSNPLLVEINRLKDEIDGWRKLPLQRGGLHLQLHRHKGLQTSLDDILSTLEWFWTRDFSKRIHSTGSSTNLLSTDSLDILLPLQMDEEIQQFKHSTGSNPYVPEFIPLPSIKSPVSMLNLKAEKALNSLNIATANEKCPEPQLQAVGLRVGSWTNLKLLQTRYQIKPGDSTDYDDGSSLWRPHGVPSPEMSPDVEAEALTTVTSLRSSTSSSGVLHEEIHSLGNYRGDKRRLLGKGVGMGRIPTGRFEFGFDGCMSGCVASCLPDVSPKWTQTNSNAKKRPWKRTTHDNCSLTGYDRSQSSNETLTLSRQEDLVFKNRRSEGINSCNGLARSSSVFVDTDDDGYEHTAISQLLLQVTDLLANTTREDVDLKLQFSPYTRQSLEAELNHLSVHDQMQRLPTLKALLLQTTSPQAPLSTNREELCQLESELFAFLANNKDEQELDPLVKLHRCLASRRIQPPYNRFLQLHLQSLLQHPHVQESEEMKQELCDFLCRLEASPQGVNLTSKDANFLLELVTMTNASVFSAVSTPPTIFSHQDSPLIVAAMKIAHMSVKLQKLAEEGQIASDVQRSVLKEAQSLVSVGETSSCPSVQFYTKVIPHCDQLQLTHLLTDLLKASNSTPTYQISTKQAKDLSTLSTRLGEVALMCAKFKVAKTHHLVKNRFRLSSTNFQRVCVISKEHHQLIKDALLLVTAAGIAKSLEVEPLLHLLDGDADVELGEEDAAYLEHLLTSAIDFRASSSIPWQQLDKSSRTPPTSNAREDFILPMDSSVVGNPFALAQTPEPLGTVDTTISEFFNQKNENAYENESLIKPTEGDSPL